MASGGDFAYEDPDLDNQLDNDDDDDGEQEVNRTQPFQPGASSTPYHVGEQVEIKTMQHEQSGLSDKTPLLTAQEESQRSWDATTIFFPEASAIELETFYSKTKRLQVKMIGFGKKVYYLFTKERGIGRQKLNPKLPKEIKKALGPMAQEIIDKQNENIIRERQNLLDDENKLKEAENLVSEKEKSTQNVENIREKLNRTRSQIAAIEDEHGSNLEIETDLGRLKQLEKNLENDLKEEEKKLSKLEKKVKEKEKLQKKAETKKERLAAQRSKRNLMQERLNQTKTLEDLKEQERELQRKKEEDQAIMQDENASPSEKEAAQGREAERNEELPRLQAQIAEREMERPLSERVKEIFKKYGVTVASVLLAAGVTIGVVVSSITNALKASTKALGKGLKDIGAKLGSLLPGLIGSIANFLFKAAGQAIGFLAEHTWLLILAVVAFLFEKYLKKRR